ncbi:chalcone--flavanone isomerase 1B-2-like [Vicia villosa]|uniref:chalcone--flavanone isomerase 1B-2-like n=1 Tax=Vicia villosa TaxID=3911 RepID=UPI00273C7F61|nr:chalcone--flavanone isomerase 1B-2-like [Vicia villosa]
MVAASSITGVTVEHVEFPAVLTSPATAKTYFLGGAGVRGLYIDGEFVKFTTIGVYLEEEAVASLIPKWKGKTPDELFESLDFYRDIIKGSFEKLIRSIKLRTLSGPKYVSKVSENCIAHIKSDGLYGKKEEKAIQELKEAFKDQNFPPGTAAFYRQSPNGTLALSFSKNETIPEHEHTIIHNKPVSEAVLESMIGEIPVSPTLKESLATRLYEFMKNDKFKIGN